MNFGQALRILECSYPNWEGVKDLQGLNEAWNKWKDTTLKKAWKASALKYHPDKHPEDKAEWANGEFTIRKQIYEDILKMDPRMFIRRPGPPPVRIIYQSWGSGATTVSATNTSGAAYGHSYTIKW